MLAFFAVDVVDGLFFAVSFSFCCCFASRFVTAGLLLSSPFGSVLRFGRCSTSILYVSLSLIPDLVSMIVLGRLPPFLRIHEVMSALLSSLLLLRFLKSVIRRFVARLVASPVSMLVGWLLHAHFDDICSSVGVCYVFANGRYCSHTLLPAKV